MKKNIYILGGEGFIGMNLAEYFGSNNNYNVYLISKRKSIFTLPSNINVFKIYDDIYNYNFTLKNNSIIIHLARFNYISLLDLKNKETDLNSYIHKFIPQKVIVFSSSVIYTENNSQYKEEKNVIENIWGLNSTIIRLFNTYGKYQLINRQGSLIALIFYNHIMGKITKINDVNQLRNFIFAGDIGKVLEKIFDKNKGVYDIGYKTISILSLLKNISKIVPLDSINILNLKENIFDIEPKEIEKIDYTELFYGLKIQYDFIKANIDIYKKI